MNWKKELLKSFKLYAITDLKSPDPKILDKIDQALSGGVDIIQLRSKLLDDGLLYQFAIQIRKLTQKRKKIFIINNRIDLMIASNADGVHLGQDDLPIQVARKLIIRQKNKFIGVSTHNVTQAIQAEKAGADYIGFGPIFATPTKPTYKPVGLSLIEKVSQKIKIPCVYIGGINQSNVDAVIQAGAKQIAVVRAIFDQLNPKQAARELKQRIAT